MPTELLRQILILALLFITTVVNAQGPGNFEKEVGELTIKYDSVWDRTREAIVFTGSSSIRFWDTLQEEFPDHQIINTGFGGSQTSDLLEHLDELVLQYKPKKVFVYEGDNDINYKKSPREIIVDITELVQRIKQDGTVSTMVLISAKPSIARWHLRGKYKRLNKKMLALCQSDPFLDFANVWDPMMNKKKLRKDLFIEDDLHMNAAGYEIWFNVIKEFIE